MLFSQVKQHLGQTLGNCYLNTATSKLNRNTFLVWPLQIQGSSTAPYRSWVSGRTAVIPMQSQWRQN